ncbi:MAG: nucleoside hydrolase [Actinomycetales bacterium]|nr:nucleoside hydrolase [Actinomycetales bacterium]
MTPIILDCDPGHDDAIAIMLAVADPAIELLAVTTVAGNVTLNHTTRNALRVLDMVGRPDIPVAAGRPAPLVRDLSTAAVMHGETGLAGPLPQEPSRPALDVAAVDLMAHTITAATEPVTLVATGPLSNVADLLTQHPLLVDQLAQIVIMGGAVDLGNWTPAAEFNIWVDPHAADIVFRHGCAADRIPGRVPLTMIGLEVTHQAWLTDEHAELLRGRSASGTFVAELLDHFVGFHQERFGWEGAPIHDAVTIAHLIDPTLVQTLAMNVQIEVDSPLCVGRTVADRWNVTGLEPNAFVGLGIDRPRFIELLMKRLLP